MQSSLVANHCLQPDLLADKRRETEWRIAEELERVKQKLNLNYLCKVSESGVKKRAHCFSSREVICIQ